MKAQHTLRENFALWHKELGTTHELALCQARAMAPALALEHRTGETGIGALRHAILDILGTAEAENLFLSLQGAAERLAFCESFLRAHPAFPAELMPSPAEEEVRVQPSAHTVHIATMRAAVSAHAKSLLPHALREAEALYCNSFQELCEVLANGNADYALLPLENSGEGILRRSYELIDRFELHIAYTVEVPTPDDGFTRIALLYGTTPPHLPVANSEEVLECRTAMTESGGLSELLAVAHTCNMSLRRIDTHANEDGELYQHVIFRTGTSDLLFATYLALFLPRTVITAKYLHLL